MRIIVVVISAIIIIMFGVLVFTATQAQAAAEEREDDASLVINRPVNVQGLTGLIMINSAYTQAKKTVVVGLSAIGENSKSPDMSYTHGIATIVAGVSDRIEVGVKAQMSSYNIGGSATRETGGGDTDLLVKWRFTSEDEDLPALAIGLGLTFPTGDTKKGLGTVKHEGIRIMVIGSSEKELADDIVFGFYFEGQLVLNDQISGKTTSPYADKYGVLNAGMLLPMTESNRLQAILEVRKVKGKDVPTIYEESAWSLIPGLRYVTPRFNITAGVQLVRRDQVGADMGARYIGTMSYSF